MRPDLPGPPAKVGSALLAGWLVSGVALAQTRPLLTETASTAEAGTLTFELGGQYIGSEPNFLTGQERDRWDAPELRLVYSPAGNVELDLEWTARVGAISDPDFGDVSDYGDVALRAKWRLLEQSAGRPAVAARFGITLPQTSFGNGLGPDTLRMAAQLLASKRLGEFELHANLGLAIHDRPLSAHRQSDFLAYGFAGGRRLGRRLTLLAELVGLAGDGAPGADERAEARLGLRFAQRRLAWDLAVRRGLTDSDGEWGFTAGLSWTITSAP